MIDFQLLKPNDSVYMLTTDVSGAYAIPCSVISVSDNNAAVGTSTGVQVIIDKDNAKAFYSTGEECLHVLRSMNKKRSYWN